jgi:hypothetical protein
VHHADVMPVPVSVNQARPFPRQLNQAALLSYICRTLAQAA